MAEKMFDGFDHTQYKDEVEDRWGKDAYRQADAWWNAKSKEGQSIWKEQMASLNSEWVAAANDPLITANSPEAQQLAAKHVAWLKSIPGTPAADPEGDIRGYVRGLAEMYVTDDRFAANYGGIAGAEFVRDTLLFYMR